MSVPKKNTPPLKPTALINFKKTDNELARIIGNFWKLTWNKENPAIDQKTKYLLSLANAVGAGRYRQATRELVKAYADGVTVAELDELFSLFVWNQGAGYFASEIGPSQLFAAYQLIKKLEAEQLERPLVLKQLAEQFGERNSAVGTEYPLSRNETEKGAVKWKKQKSICHCWGMFSLSSTCKPRTAQ